MKKFNLYKNIVFEERNNTGSCSISYGMKKTAIKILIVLILSGSFFIPQTAEAAITFVSSTEDVCATSCISSNQRTITMDIGTRTNGLLVVGIGVRETSPNPAETPTAVTYGGVSMSKATSTQTASANRDYEASIWYLANPTNGSNNLVITFNNIGSPTAVYTQASWYDGANQTQASVLDDTASDGVDATSPYDVDLVPTENNTVLVSFYASNNAAVLTVGTGETLIIEEDAGAHTYGASYAIQTTATTQTMDWTGGNDNTALVAVNFKEASAAVTPAGPVGRPRFLRFGTLILLSGTFIIY